MEYYTRLMSLLPWWRSPVAPPALTERPRHDLFFVRHDSVLNPATGLGSSLDKGALARPDRAKLPLSTRELSALYRHNGIAARIVKTFPNHATRAGWSTPELDDEYERLDVLARVREAMTWGRLYGTGALLMLTEDDVPRRFRSTPQKWLRQPLERQRVGAVRALVPFDMGDMYVGEWGRSLEEPETYNMPRTWNLQLLEGSVEVHASRLVTFYGAHLPPSERRRNRSKHNGIADSSLQPIWDEIRHLTEISAAGAALAQELIQGVLFLKGLEDFGSSDQGNSFVNKISLMQRLRGVLKDMVIGDGDRFERHEATASGFSELSAGAKSLICAVSGIPEVILFGAAPDGLNTDGDSAQQGFRQTIRDYQIVNMPAIMKLDSVLLSAQDGPTGGVLPERRERTPVLHPLNEASDLELAEVRKLTAEHDAIVIAQGVARPEDITKQRYGKDGWKLELVDIKPLDEDELPAQVLPGQKGSVGMVAGNNGGRGAGESGAPPEQQPQGEQQPRQDEADLGDYAILYIEAPEFRMSGLVASALQQGLVQQDDPHVTVLYLGMGLDDDAMMEVVEVAVEEVSRRESAVLQATSLSTFPEGKNGVPLVLRFEDAYVLEGLEAALQRRLAHHITARQFAAYRPHMTVGYLGDEPTPEQAAGLLNLDVSSYVVHLKNIVIKRGNRVWARVPVGA